MHVRLHYSRFNFLTQTTISFNFYSLLMIAKLYDIQQIYIYIFLIKIKTLFSKLFEIV